MTLKKVENLHVFRPQSDGKSSKNNKISSVQSHNRRYELLFTQYPHYNDPSQNSRL